MSRVVELLLLHFGIAASMAAGFALLPIAYAAVLRLRDHNSRRSYRFPADLRRREQYYRPAALDERLRKSAR